MILQLREWIFKTNQLNSLNIEHQRLPAYVISDKQDQIYQKLYKTWQRPLSIPEVSCFLSHKVAWEQVIENQQPMLILEDDAWLAPNFTPILKELSNLKDIDYVNLEVTGRNKKKLIEVSASNAFSNSELFRIYQGRSGTGGYVIWPAGAKKLLDKFKKGKIAIADKFITSCHSLLAYQLEPAVLIQLDQCEYHNITPPLEAKTSITNKPRDTVNIIDFIRFRIRRFFGEFQIGLNILKNKKYAIRRSILLSDSFKK